MTVQCVALCRLFCSVKFGHFDILKDEEIRQGLKVFSNWPTYPQLYARGELVGGLDIVKVGNFYTISYYEVKN